MKKTIRRLDRYRILSGPLKSSPRDGRNGAFLLPAKLFNRHPITLSMNLVISDGTGWDSAELGDIAWEHASASWPDRCPTWSEMARVKELLWDDHELVIQFHVPTREHVNYHPHCLHLWKPIGIDVPTPPSICVGPLTSEGTEA